MKRKQFIPWAILALIMASACQLSQALSFLSTATPTPTNTPTLTATSTPIPPTPTSTPIPIASGSWKGVADGWNPPLTISFNVTAETGTYHVTNIVIYIPNIDTTSYLTQIRCTIQVDSLPVMDNAFKFAQGGVTVFDGQFNDSEGVSGNIYGGWLCENRLANFGPNDSYVTWHAEWKKP